MSKGLVGGIIAGCKDKTSSWPLNGFPDDGSNIFFLISLIADGPHHYHHILPVVTQNLPISPRGSHLTVFHRDASSAIILTIRQLVVEFYFLTFPHFPLQQKK